MRYLSSCGPSGSDPHFLLAAVALDSSALAYAVEDGSSCLALVVVVVGDDDDDEEDDEEE